MRAAFQDEGARRQVVRKAIEHDIAGLESRRPQRRLAAPGIVAAVLRFEDRAGREEQPAETARRLRGDARERRRRALHPRQVRLAQQRNAGEVDGALQGFDLDAAELANERGRERDSNT